jgi:hypothetical protein
MPEITPEARRELTRAVAVRYRAAAGGEKRRILDEFIAVVGYHRKHAIRVLNGSAAAKGPRAGGRRTLYDEACVQALTVLWEASDRVCGKRLKAVLPVLVPALERHGHLHLDAIVRSRVLAASAATIDRLMRPARQASGRRRRHGKPAVRQAIKIRTFADWGDPLPGFMEADLVAHSGQSMAGSFAHTLVLTDIATAWTECVALLVREGTLVVHALERVCLDLPFLIRGIDTDNGLPQKSMRQSFSDLTT